MLHSGVRAVVATNQTGAAGLCTRLWPSHAANRRIHPTVSDGLWRMHGTCCHCTYRRRLSQVLCTGLWHLSTSPLAPAGGDHAGAKAVWTLPEESNRIYSVHNSSLLVLTLVQDQQSWGRGTPPVASTCRLASLSGRAALVRRTKFRLQTVA